jgi:hypothetical protein
VEEELDRAASAGDGRSHDTGHLPPGDHGALARSGHRRPKLCAAYWWAWQPELELRLDQRDQVAVAVDVRFAADVDERA